MNCERSQLLSDTIRVAQSSATVPSTKHGGTKFPPGLRFSGAICQKEFRMLQRVPRKLKQKPSKSTNSFQIFLKIVMQFLSGYTRISTWTALTGILSIWNGLLDTVYPDVEYWAYLTKIHFATHCPLSRVSVITRTVTTSSD